MKLKLVLLAGFFMLALIVQPRISTAHAALVQIQQISTDPYTNTTSQHATQVESDSFAVGNTIVSAFQTGRFFDGGASNIGWSTSTDGGVTWTSGFLPSLTVFSAPAGTSDRGSDPSVAYDQTHGVWLISVLALTGSSAPLTTSIVVSRSTDGLNWSAPIVAAPATGGTAHDKEWIVCDNGTSSPFKGRCYISYSDFVLGKTGTRTSTDGGLTWGASIGSADATAGGIGTQPVVQPNGRLVVLIWNPGLGIISFASTDGGASFGAVTTASAVTWHGAAGLRNIPIPSAEVDAAGKIYVVWSDCRFRTGCSADDIVLATSSDGTTWSAVSRVPIDKVNSGIEHLLPGLAVDPSTSGATAKLAITFYSLPSASCTAATCELNAGFIASGNGGARWAQARKLNATPMPLSWLPDTTNGRMVGDYVATAFVNGGFAVPVFAIASAPSGALFHEAMYAITIRVR